ncbi:MAG: hypothetical protein ACTSVU_05810 [Promethearchaeota archaeon]
MLSGDYFVGNVLPILIIMQIFGDVYCKVSGRILTEMGNFVKIEFEKEKKTVYVPRYLIKHRISGDMGANCNYFSFFLPEWFLKKNRIIPKNLI